MLKLIAALLSVPVAGVALVAGTGIAVVDVREGGANGHRIVVPVPLLLAEGAAMMVPTHRASVHVPELTRVQPMIDAAITALHDVPDCELVRVEEPGEQVVISKRGDVLQVRVHDHADEVSVDIPLEAAAQMMKNVRDGRVDAQGMVAALRHHARMTSLVDVHSGQDHVKVSIW
jgi:hypothetical protein